MDAEWVSKAAGVAAGIFIYIYIYVYIYFNTVEVLHMMLLLMNDHLGWDDAEKVKEDERQISIILVTDFLKEI